MVTALSENVGSTGRGGSAAPPSGIDAQPRPPLASSRNLIPFRLLLVMLVRPRRLRWPRVRMCLQGRVHVLRDDQLPPHHFPVPRVRAHVLVVAFRRGRGHLQAVLLPRL